MTSWILTWGPTLTCAVLVFVSSQLQGLPTVDQVPFSDKVAHLVMYSVFGATLAWARYYGRMKTSSWALLGWGAVYAALDEFHQAFVPTRDPSLADLGADLVGLVLGYHILSWLLSAFAPSRPEEPESATGPARS